MTTTLAVTALTLALISLGLLAYVFRILKAVIEAHKAGADFALEMVSNMGADAAERVAEMRQRLFGAGQ